MDIAEQMPFLKQLTKGLSTQFGSKCEVAVHDLTNGPESTIIAIENGHVTGRKIGDGAGPVVMRVLQDPHLAVDNTGYLTRTNDGRLLRSSSIYLKDENGLPIALLSINYDFTELSNATSVLLQYMGIQSDRAQHNGIDTIFSGVSNILDRLIEESAVLVGKPVALMNKDDKVKAIKYLDEKGAFLIRNSGDKVSKYFDISKYTLYNYLDYVKRMEMPNP